jgi:hypothetical protein
MDKDNVVEIDEDFHKSLHVVFGTLVPELYSKFLSIVLQPDTRWTSKDLHRLRNQLMREWHIDQFLSH